LGALLDVAALVGRFCAPNLHRPLLVGGRQEPAVGGAEGDAKDLVRMPLERGRLVSRSQVPNGHRVVRARPSQELTVATEREVQVGADAAGYACRHLAERGVGQALDVDPFPTVEVIRTI